MFSVMVRTSAASQLWMFLCSYRFSVVLEPRDRLQGLGGKVGSACEDNERGILS